MLFLIPARAGSKRLPGKNTRLFCGLPLWLWSLATAQRIAGNGDYIRVSTDDLDILRSGHPHVFVRHTDLCQDRTSSLEVVAAYLECHDVCLLQPTSPTRTDSLVRKLIAHGGQVRSVTSGKPNGQCYIYRRGQTEWTDIETEQGHDIDTLDQFNEAEAIMLGRFQ